MCSAHTCMETKRLQMLWIGDHESCSTFMHNVPSVYTFGWKTWHFRSVRGHNSSLASEAYSRIVATSLFLTPGAPRW